MNERIDFDSDKLRGCECGSKTITVEFFADGKWRIDCPVCHRYWPGPPYPYETPYFMRPTVLGPSGGSMVATIQ
jgi:hypothetical protein